jgi:hypothetical protein
MDNLAINLRDRRHLSIHPWMSLHVAQRCARCEVFDRGRFAIHDQRSALRQRKQPKAS